MPLAPILMHPAYRFGASTPWGGSRLAALYGKDIPDPRTGESLEVSALPGMCSTDPDGTPLTELVRRYGKALTGRGVRGDFPLLLKLIDAKEQLSVQVHPDDLYARQKESRCGKTEAWVILHADPGARIVYGVKNGVTKQDLKEASEKGAAVEDLLRFFPVAAGDAFIIPAGTVHATGAGIVLYEIQQPSDLTYRFYDWERRDRDGNRRTLHLKQALDVAVLDGEKSPEAPRQLPADGGGSREGLVSCVYFSTERYTGCEGTLLPQDRGLLGILTALSPARIEYGGGKSLPLRAGQTVLLPAAGGSVRLYGAQFLLSRPGPQEP